MTTELGWQSRSQTGEGLRIGKQVLLELSKTVERRTHSTSVRVCPEKFRHARNDVLGEFYGQATKGVRWMPWRQKATKDVASCDKPRGAASRL